MKKTHYANETGEMTIHGARMAWTMKRSKTESAFGIRGSRIFYLELKKNGMVIGSYDRGWTKQISKEDEEGSLCLSFLVDKFGKQAIKRRKEIGFQE